MAERKLLTIREIARRLGVQVHRVKYAVAEYEIPPHQRAGIVRLWTEEDVATVRAAVDRIARRKGDTRGN